MLCVALGVLAGMMLATGCDQAGANGAASEAKPQIVVVDAMKVSSEVGRDEDLRTQLTSAGQQLQQQLQQQQTKYRAEIEAKRETFGDNPTDEQQAELARMAQAANRNLNQLQTMAQQRIQQMQAGLVNQFRDELAPIAQKIAQEHGAKVAMINNGNILWYDGAIDVTDEVIGALQAAGGPTSATDSPVTTPTPQMPATTTLPNAPATTTMPDPNLMP